jgi:hypothetical protein
MPGFFVLSYIACSIRKRGEFFITDYSSSLTKADMLGEAGNASAPLWVRLCCGRIKIETS